MQSHGARPGRPLLRAVLRKEARRSVGDTGLLDHLLRHMADSEVAPGLVFRRQFNPQGAMEYWLEDEGEEEEDGEENRGGKSCGQQRKGKRREGGECGGGDGECQCCSSGCEGVRKMERTVSGLTALVEQLQR